MLIRRTYYWLKPYLPWSLRMALRRWRAKRKRPACAEVWPINESAGIMPHGWPGWPEGKKFAFLLTHDIEGPEGLARVPALMQLERKLGFRSSYNFIPEGPYRVSREVREELTANGFEVGVHDLHHDGKLYLNRDTFRSNAERINYYLKEWGAVGFRSGFMLHELHWLHDLEIEYDASTFDTDPFEPQPEGVNTIFPFWVSNPRESLNAAHAPNSTRTGYIELPYTLPQDSTLFLLLREKNIALWQQKLDWVAERGGMVFFDVHPDYLRWEGDSPSGRTYPVTHYSNFLQQVREKYDGAFWQPLPKELARFARSIQPETSAPAAPPPKRAHAISGPK